MQEYPKHMKVSELSAYARIPAATIWYYARMGLLPEPVKSGGKKAYYTAEHLEILEKIRSLKERGLSLAAIGEVLKGECESSANSLESDSIFSSKRDAIVKAAIELFYQKGYNATTIKDIVVKAGSGKDTFYQYFKDKEDLILECADHVFYEIGRDEPSVRDEQDGMKRLWNRAYSFHHDYHHLVDMLNLARGFSVTHDSRFEQMLEKVMHNLIAPLEADLLTARRQGQIHFKDVRRIAHFLMGASEYFSYYLQSHPDKNVDDCLAKAWDMILQGLSSGQDSEAAGGTRAERNLLKMSELLRGAGVSTSSRKDGMKAELPPAGKRDSILSISTRLFLQKGYAETNVADIAQQGKMSKETIYRHFKNKEEIFMACADRIFFHMYDEVWSEIKGERDLFLRLVKRGKAFFASYGRWIPMMKIVKGLSVGDNPSFKAKFHEIIMQMVNPMRREIEALIQEGRLRKDIDSELASYILLGISEYGAQFAYREHAGAEAILSTITTILVKGLSKA